jgi:hypothetical protein
MTSRIFVVAALIAFALGAAPALAQSCDRAITRFERAGERIGGEIDALSRRVNAVVDRIGSGTGTPLGAAEARRALWDARRVGRLMDSSSALLDAVERACDQQPGFDRVRDRIGALRTRLSVLAASWPGVIENLRAETRRLTRVERAARRGGA